MMHTPSDAFQAGPPGQSHLAPSRVSQMPRNTMYNTHIAGMGYRGPSALPVAPYAFQSTPHLRQENRTLSAPVYRHSMGPPPSSRYQQEDSSSSSTASTASSSNLSSVGQHHTSKDDSSVGIKQRQTLRDNRHSTALVASLSTPDLSLGAYDAIKASPDRYRRISRRFEEVTNPSSSQQIQDTQVVPRPLLPTQVSLGSQQTVGNAFSDTRQGSYDDATGSRQQSSTRYKRRSVGKMDAGPAPVVTIASPINSSVPTWSQIVAGRHNPALLPPSHRPVRHVRSSSGDLRGSSPRPSSVSTSRGFIRLLPLFARIFQSIAVHHSISISLLIMPNFGVAPSICIMPLRDIRAFEFFLGILEFFILHVFLLLFLLIAEILNMIYILN
jgi:hypothetical protein